MVVQRFDTSILDAALQRRQEKWERERLHILEQVRHFLDDWGNEYGIRRAYLFGSVVRPGRFGAHSDVDVAVEQVATLAFFRLIAHLSHALGRPVDIVELDDCPFADKIRKEGLEWKPSA